MPATEVFMTGIRRVMTATGSILLALSEQFGIFYHLGWPAIHPLYPYGIIRTIKLIRKSKGFWGRWGENGIFLCKAV